METKMITNRKDIDIINYVKNMYKGAKKRRDELTFENHNLYDLEKILNNQPGFIRAMWCGNEACENKTKEIRGCKSRCILENEKPIDDKCICCVKKASKTVMWGIQY